MALIEKVKGYLEEREMTFTDLANKMETPRAGLYKSIQSESIKYSMLKKLAEALDIHVANLFLKIDIHTMEYLDGELFMAHRQLNHLVHQMVALKHGKITIEEIQSSLDAFASLVNFRWRKRVCKTEFAEELYNSRIGEN
jgi:predicted transcriptional regulator